jgi:hypothetical protein
MRGASFLILLSSIGAALGCEISVKNVGQVPHLHNLLKIVHALQIYNVLRSCSVLSQ